MIGETLEITIVVSMIVLIAYPSTVALRQVMQERRERRIKIVAIRDRLGADRPTGRIRKQDRV
jgi:hypothetical protein